MLNDGDRDFQISAIFEQHFCDLAGPGLYRKMQRSPSLVIAGGCGCVNACPVGEQGLRRIGMRGIIRREHKRRPAIVVGRIGLAFM